MLRIAGAGALLATLGGAIQPAQLEIDVTGLRSQKGIIRICLTTDPKNFPGCTDDRNAITRSIKASAPTVRIGGLAAGEYAVALIHDENGNAKLDTFAGIPKEGIGFSRNPTVTFGPPRFTSARFAIGQATAEQTIRMKYFL